MYAVTDVCETQRDAVAQLQQLSTLEGLKQPHDHTEHIELTALVMSHTKAYNRVCVCVCVCVRICVFVYSSALTASPMGGLATPNPSLNTVLALSSKIVVISTDGSLVVRKPEQ